MPPVLSDKSAVQEAVKVERGTSSPPNNILLASATPRNLDVSVKSRPAQKVGGSR